MKNALVTTVKNSSKIPFYKKIGLATALAFPLSLAEGQFFISNATGESGGGAVTSGMTSAMTTAFNNVQADVVSIITTALPPALAIMGLILAIRVGIRWFRSAAK